MNIFPMKTTKIQYKNRLPYITSGLRKSIQYKHILDTFMPKIQLMKINRNVELLITN